LNKVHAHRVRLFTGIIREIAGKYPDKPVVVSSCGNYYRYYEEELEKDNTVVYYFSLDRAAKSACCSQPFAGLCRQGGRVGCQGNPGIIFK